MRKGCGPEKADTVIEGAQAHKTLLVVENPIDSDVDSFFQEQAEHAGPRSGPPRRRFLARSRAPPGGQTALGPSRERMRPRWPSDAMQWELPGRTLSQCPRLRSARSSSHAGSRRTLFVSVGVEVGPSQPDRRRRFHGSRGHDFSTGHRCGDSRRKRCGVHPSRSR